MVNFPEEMIFAAGTRKSSAQFAVAKCTAERGDSTDYPQHEQRKSGMNIRYLKAEAGKHAGADDVSNHNPACGEKADGASWHLRRRSNGQRSGLHAWIDNPEITGSREFFRSSIRLHGLANRLPTALLYSGASKFVRLSAARLRVTLQTMNATLSIESATQLAVFLANRPGALARVCEALAKAEINIHALATSDTVDHSVVRMVVRDPTKALMLLGEAGVLALESDVLMIEAENEPGVLAKIAEQLSRAEVNIEYGYLAASPKAATGLIILRPSDVEKAQRALRDL